ncbi:MAG TPA: GxxExxY protein, partial [Anaerolineales bacterium]|nr:GxxExxY protein [Anaerolineales bacterium]
NNYLYLPQRHGDTKFFNFLSGVMMVQPKFLSKRFRQIHLEMQLRSRHRSIHRELGPGLLEGMYKETLDIECRIEGLHVLRQIKVPVLYGGKQIGEYKPDMLVNDLVIVEIKSVERLIQCSKPRC